MTVTRSDCLFGVDLLRRTTAPIWSAGARPQEIHHVSYAPLDTAPQRCVDHSIYDGKYTGFAGSMDVLVQGCPRDHDIYYHPRSAEANF